MYDSQNIQSALSRIENKKVREQFDRSGFYRAIVVSNSDPMGIGRIKIRIPALHGVDTNQPSYVDDTMLPYAFPGVIQGAGYREGQYLLPSAGHVVWVSFEAGTDNFIYFGGLYSKAPEKGKYIYKGRSVNNGDPIFATDDDIPSNYHPDRHILYRSISGDIIYIDDRRLDESIVLENRTGNKISFGDKTITIVTANPIEGYFPYMDIMYCDSKHMDSLIFNVDSKNIFTDTSLHEVASTIRRGNTVVFTNNGKIKGTGIVDTVSSNSVRIKLILQS